MILACTGSLALLETASHAQSANPTGSPPQVTSEVPVTGLQTNNAVTFSIQEAPASGSTQEIAPLAPRVGNAINAQPVARPTDSRSVDSSESR
jgi:hypothetical protein